MSQGGKQKFNENELIPVSFNEAIDILNDNEPGRIDTYVKESSTSQGGKQSFNELKPTVSFNDDINKQAPVLLMHEDGTVEQQECWTDDLHAGIEAGVVEVIRFVDGKFQYFNEPGWKEVGTSETVSSHQTEMGDSNGDEMVSEGGPVGEV